jgi:4-amino-4-deoxy-L-arabinose transferase-like glycosyltransferase
MIFLQRYRTEIIIALVALVWHVFCFTAVVAAHNGTIVEAVRADDGYYELAQNVLSGHGYSMATTSPYAPNSLRTPGYIAFIVGTWILIGSAAGSALIQLLLACAIPVLGMYIARYLTRSSRVGIFTGVILALDPTLALLSFQFYTETVFLILFFGWLLVTFRYFERPTWATLLSSAVLLGLATLVKASTQFIPCVIVACIMWLFGRTEWRRGLVHTGVFLAVIAAILAPWIMRNVYTFGSFGLSTQTAYVLYTNFAPAVRSVSYNTDFNQEVATFSTWEERVGSAITFENASVYTQKALVVMTAHPFASLYVAGKSLITFFTHDGIATLVIRSGGSQHDFLAVVVVARLLWIALTIAAGIGAIIFLSRERSLLAVFCITLITYFALTSTIAAFGTNPRYRLPVDPLLIAFAAIGVSYALEHNQHFRRNLHAHI